MVILFPVLLIMLFGAVQAGLYFHARNLAMSAAQEGARVAAAYDSTTGRGTAAAREFATATVMVTVDSPNLLDFLIPDMPIHQSATMPLERIT